MARAASRAATRLASGAPPRGDLDVAVRFHLHPGVTTQRVSDGGVLLTLPDGVRFMFEAGDAPVAIEESVFFASPHGPRPTEQIVIHARTDATLTIAWRFARIADAQGTDATS